MNLFIVASLYQLFNVINLCESKFGYEESDVLFVDPGNNIERGVDLDYLKSFFHDVHYIKIENCTEENKYKFLFKELFSKKIFSVKINQKYENVFLAGTEMFSKMIAFKLREKNGDIYYYEDGIASYYEVMNVETKNKKDSILKLRYGARPLEICKKLYVYEPDCVTNNSNQIPVGQLEKIVDSQHFKIDIKRVFSAEKYVLDKPCVFLNAWFNDKEQYNLQRRLLDKMLSVVGTEKSLVKLHPNEIGTIDENDGVNYLAGKASFEVCNFGYDYSNQIFVSIISTACLTPKMIYDQEPYIIYLYKIFEKDYPMWEDVDETIKKLISCYKNPEKVFIPESWEEYEQVLETIKDIL